jgi:GntR family transcriptional regulator
MFSVNIRGGSPINEQLCERLTELISAGVLKSDEKLPAVREVAKQLGVNPNTVQKAYQLLEQRGLIYSIPAKGSYVSPSEDAVAALREAAMKGFSESVKHALNCGVKRQDLVAAIENIRL